MKKRSTSMYLCQQHLEKRIQLICNLSKPLQVSAKNNYSAADVDSSELPPDMVYPMERLKKTYGKRDSPH